MQKNVSGYDRLARLIAGPLLIIAGIAGYAGFLTLAVGPVPQALASILVVLVGAILLVTGLVQKCVINALLGINTYHNPANDTTDEPPADIDQEMGTGRAS